MLSTFRGMRNLYHALLRGWDDARWSVCPLCSGASRGGRFCADCLADLPRHHGPVTGLRAAGVPEPCFAAYDYVFPLAGLLRAGKFHGDLAVIHALGEAFAEALAPQLPACDLAVAVPLSLQRYVMRGYNQTLLLGRRLALECKCSLSYKHLEIKRSPVAQSSLGAAERALNIRGAFRARERLAGERVLLIDDVITTGATLAAATSALQQAGAGEVVAVALAATPVSGRQQQIPNEP